MEFSYASFMRWQRRMTQDRMPIEKPGPKKLLPLDFADLQAGIAGLKHCRIRTRETEVLHIKHGAAISRRELNQLVKESRLHENQTIRKAQWRLTWNRPNLVWAADGCEVRTGSVKIHVQNMQDLYSLYKFDPLVTSATPCGKRIAAYLSACFKKYGPPLFFKRDNAGNYNCSKVNGLLENSMVIPINSPGYYAAYNGSIEHAQGEVKTVVGKKPIAATEREASLLLEAAVCELNHKSRRLLKGQTACHRYFNGDRIRYSKRKRKEVFEWIRDLAFDISFKSGMEKIDPVAWRIACRKWLEKNGMLVIQRSTNVLPKFSLSLCQN